MWMGTVSQEYGSALRMFDVARVRGRHTLRVPEATRDEVWSQLQAYKNTGRYFMLGGSEVDAFSVEYHRTISSGLLGEVRKASLYTPGPTRPHKKWRSRSRDMD